MIEVRILELVQGNFRGQETDHAWIAIEAHNGNWMQFRVDVDSRGNFHMPYLNISDASHKSIQDFKITPE